MSDQIFIRMLKTAVGPNFGPFLAGFDYRVSKKDYESLRAGNACRQLRDTDAVRKAAKAPPKVAGGGEELFSQAKKAEDDFIDAPLPPDVPPILGIIQAEAVSAAAIQPQNNQRK